MLQSFLFSFCFSFYSSFPLEITSVIDDHMSKDIIKATLGRKIDDHVDSNTMTLTKGGRAKFSKK